VPDHETPESGRGLDRPGREATTHLAYREWASEALGDERQVYARSTKATEDDELVFLPDGAADRFRAAAQAGELVCPVPGCPSPLLTTRGSTKRRHHFVHRQAPPNPAHQRAYVRRVATQLLADWIRVAHPRSTVETDVPVGEVPVTVLVTGPAGAQFAVVFVDRRLGVDAWWDANLELERAGMAGGWIFAPRQYLRYPQPTTGATPDDPAVRDRQRGDIVLDRALFRGDAWARQVAPFVECHHPGAGQPHRIQRPARPPPSARPACITRSRAASGARPA
jgi:hypothetical protein